MRMNRMRTIIILSAIALMTLAGVAPVYASYTLADLGVMKPKGVNDSGQIAGYIGEHAVLYANGTLEDLGSFNGGRFTKVQAITNNGRILAWNYNPNNAWLIEGYIYDTRTKALTDMGSLGTNALLSGINEAGQVVGRYYPPASTSGNSHNFVYNNGTINDVGTWGGRYINYRPTINNNGKIAGSNSTDGYGTRSYISNLDGKGAVYIGDLGKDSSNMVNTVLCGFNDSGYAVGSAKSSTDSQTHAYLYDGQNMIDLHGFLGPKAYRSEATFLNNNGLIVGYYYDTSFNTYRYIYDNGVVTDLDAVAAGLGLTITSVDDINNNGWIIGTGTLNGQTRGFLLAPESAPVPVPPAFWMFGSGLIGLIGTRRKFFSV